jgi:hypothetical protein
MISKEWMIQKIIDIVPLLWVFLENTRYKVFGIAGHFNMLRETDLISYLGYFYYYYSAKIMLSIDFKRWFTEKHLIS